MKIEEGTRQKLQATYTVSKRSKLSQPLDLHFISLSSSSSHSLSVPSDQWVCRYSNNSPLFYSPLSPILQSRLGFLDSDWKTVPFPRFQRIECAIHPHPEKVAEKRGGGWRIRARRCRWRWHKSSRRRWRIGGTRLTSQLGGKMGSSSLSVELMLSSPPSLSYVYHRSKSSSLHQNETFFLFDDLKCLSRSLIWGVS